MATPVRDTWESKVVTSTTVNDSDQAIAVTLGEQWHIMSVHVKYASTATAGNRQIVLQLLSGATVVDEVRAGLVQAASKTYYYTFQPGAENMIALVDSDWLTTHIPPTWILGYGESVRVLDNNAVAAAADDMEIRMRVLARSV